MSRAAAIFYVPKWTIVTKIIKVLQTLWLYVIPKPHFTARLLFWYTFLLVSTELLMAFREPNLKPLHMLRTVFGAADTHLRGKGKISSTFNRFYDWSYETEHPQQTIVFTKSQPRERTLFCHDSICRGTGLRESLMKMISSFHVIHEQILTFKVYSILFLFIITKPKLQLEL